ncbi:MAG: SDR family NAD(P)-dependent oxidoreductase [Lapillicoccus sp.]
MVTRTGGSRRFTGRVVLVTGGGAGIGRACGQRLAAEGARVALADLDAESAQRTAAELDDAHRSTGGHLAVRMDVTDRTSVDAAVTGVVDQTGHLDVLVAVAGGDLPHPDLEHTDDEVWRAMLELNLLGAVRACRAAIPTSAAPVARRSSWSAR